MALFADITEAKNATFNGTKFERILFNGIEVFKSIFDAFKNGVLDPSCTISGTFKIEDNMLKNRASVSKSSQNSYAHGFMNLDLTNYSYLYINGECNLHAGKNGSCGVGCGINKLDETIYSIDSGDSSYTFSYRIDVSDYTGEQTLYLTCYAACGTDNEEKYAECNIFKIFLE